MKCKVLIIDDEEDTCVLLITFLKQLGYQPFSATSLKQAMKILAEVQPDVIFLDNNLPDGLGWNHLSQIHAMVPQCRINLMSAYDLRVRQPRENIQVQLIEKPITFAALKKYL